MAELPSALERFDRIAEAVGGSPVAVFLDFDGTLSPIVDDPDAAVLPEPARAAVTRLAEAATVAVVSGRDLEDVRTRAGVPGVLMVGSHGFDILGPDGRRLEQPEAAELLRELDVAEWELRDQLGSLSGVHVERKRYAIAAHHRRVDPSMGPEVERVMRATSDRHPGLAVSGGKKVFELRPALDWHKGAAVRWLLSELNLEDAVPIYVGDDLTDEDAFRELQDRGIGVVVLGEDDRHTSARYSLAGPDEVPTFLAHLAELAENRRRR
jgi:trehalose 6-phosphate phosphatase